MLVLFGEDPRHGPDVLLMVDGNNGFDGAGAIRMFREVGPLQIFWAEEMFPETVEDCRAFQTFLREHGWATLIADGETQGSVEPMLPIMEQQLKAVQDFLRDGQISVDVSAL